jgi:hypothetical protein
MIQKRAPVRRRGGCYYHETDTSGFVPCERSDSKYRGGRSPYWSMVKNRTHQAFSRVANAFRYQLLDLENIAERTVREAMPASNRNNPKLD